MPPARFDIARTLQEAVALHRQGRLRDADKLYARVLKAAPGNFDALHLQGLVKAQSGQMGEAFRLMTAALKTEPRAADAWSNLAGVLHALKRDAEALDALDKARALRPTDPAIEEQRGHALLTLGRPEEALASFDAVLARQPANGKARLGRGVARAALGRAEDALADFDAALAQAPGQPEALYNRGNALLALGRPAEAADAFAAALAAAPRHAKAWNNRGRALQALGRHREAVACFDQAIAIGKDDADAHFNRALSLLTLGDLAPGFAAYEWRWRRTGMADTRRHYKGPPWLGEFPPGARTLLLHAEQGLGDTIQFARYVPQLARGGTRVVLEVQPALKPLLSSLDGVAACCARGETLPAYDLHCPLGSLPLALKTTATTVPADIPYLAADAEKVAAWRPVIEALPGKRIAIAWAGHARHVNDRNRSIDLALIEPLFARAGVSFVSIQRDLREGDAERLGRHPQVTHVGERLADMADTAAVLALADLTLVVDTAVAHLAGALGRPLWVMLPFAPDWRWTADAPHSPWYPDARLFRQTALGDWPRVIAAVGEALGALA